MLFVPDIRQIRVFLALEETRSFTAAAEKLNITQSAVSHSIKSLERSLECELIERLGKKCILSPHGEVFFHHAKRALEQLESAVQKILTLNKWGYNSIKVGASNTLCQYVVPSALANFYNTEKRTEIFLTPGDISTLVKSLNTGALDLAFGLYKKSLEQDYKFIPIVDDRLCFITKPDHSWCRNPPKNSEDFEKERFVIYGNESVTKQIIDAHLSGIGIRQRTTLAIGNMDSIKQMASLGIGVGIVSEWIAKKELKDGSLVKHDINPAPKRTWGIYTIKSKGLSLPEEKFIGEFKGKFLSLVN